MWVDPSEPVFSGEMIENSIERNRCIGTLRLTAKESVPIQGAMKRRNRKTNLLREVIDQIVFENQLFLVNLWLVSP